MIAERHAAGEDLLDILPQLARAVRPAHGRRNVQQPGAGPDRVRRRGQRCSRACSTRCSATTGRRPFDANGPAPGGVTNTNYATTGNVVDADPRIISNLIVDQTANNPRGGSPARRRTRPTASRSARAWTASSARPTTARCSSSRTTAPGRRPVGAVQLLDDVLRPVLRPRPRPRRQGRQRHGLHPAAAGRSAHRGRDGIVGTADDCPTNFMVLTRADQSARAPTASSAPPTTSTSTTTRRRRSSTRTRPTPRIPRTRCSCASTCSTPTATGRQCSDRAGLHRRTPNWRHRHLGRGQGAGARHARHPARPTPTSQRAAAARPTPTATSSPAPNGFAQIVTGSVPTASPGTADDVVEGNRRAPISLRPARCAPATRSWTTSRTTPCRAVSTRRQSGTPRLLIAGRRQRRRQRIAGRRATYDDELLDAHFITGDGRGNENIGLTAVHHVFHAEHNRLVEHIKDVVARVERPRVPERVAARRRRVDARHAGADRRAASGTASACSRRPASAPRCSTSISCSRSSRARSSRRSTSSCRRPGLRHRRSIRRSSPSSRTSVYRFGHSMLTETIDRFDPTSTCRRRLTRAQQSG